MSNKVKLNLGCGAKFVDGWINVDYSVGARLSTIPLIGYFVKLFRFFNVQWDQRIFIHNLTKPFPWQTGTISVIYSSHTLEHMDRESGIFFLKECHRVLRSDGTIRIVVPNLLPICEKYIAGTLAAENFLEELYVLKEKPPKSFIKRLLWPYVGFPHLCMYDTNALIKIMESVGFYVKHKSYGDSEIEDIKSIEIEERCVDAVVVEGKKV